ncbi:MAG: NADH-quinone oxidoreductase subunit J family protein [Anaerolineae bacterium]
MISLSQIVFLLFSAVALGAAARVVTSHRVFHAAMWLVGSFFGIAAIYMLLESPFMAGIQLFIYIGGVAVLTVIAIMVTKGIMDEDRRTVNDPWSALIVALSVFGVMVWMIVQVPLPVEPLFPVPEGGIALLGAALVDPAGFLLPFQVVSIMLLVVLLASLFLGRER